MGQRGRAPKPTSLRLLHGDRESRINRDEPTPRPSEPVCPEAASDEVRAVWEEAVAELRAMSLAFSADADSLRCYCEAVVAHRKASAVLAQSPVLVKGLHGNMVRNPALQIQRDTAQTVRAFAQEFGLTPSARSQIKSAESNHGEQNNPFAASG